MRHKSKKLQNDPKGQKNPENVAKVKKYFKMLKKPKFWKFPKIFHYVEKSKMLKNTKYVQKQCFQTNYWYKNVKRVANALKTEIKFPCITDAFRKYIHTTKKNKYKSKYKTLAIPNIKYSFMMHKLMQNITNSTYCKRLRPKYQTTVCDASVH